MKLRNPMVLSAACLIGAALLTPTTVLASPGIGVNTQAASLVPQAIKEQGYFTVATDASYPPFEYFSANNNIVGYDIDIINAMAHTLGLKAHIQNVPFSSIIPGLQAHKYDLSISAFGITKKRKKVIDFVGPYFVSGAGIAVLKANPAHITKDPMSMCGHAIGAEKGTTESDGVLPFFSKQCVKKGKKPITIMVYANQNQVNLALTSGRIVGQAAEAEPLRYMTTHVNKEFKVIPGADFFPTNYGIAIPKDSELEPAIKAALHAIQKDGVLNKISAKWGIPQNRWKHPAPHYKIYD